MSEQTNDVPNMQLTSRDVAIFETIHSCDGMLGAQQIQRLFFSGWYQTRTRLTKLWKNGWVDRPERAWRAALPDMVYWLTSQSAEYLAALNGQTLAEFYWQSRPRPKLIPHDLRVNDFRLDVMEACELYPQFRLEEWVTGGEFWRSPDTISFRNNDGKSVKRQVRPDGYFAIRHGNQRFRFLLEIDMGTEDNPRLGREKMVPGAAYMLDKAYEKRFGANTGRWLFVTTSERRVQHMKAQAERDVNKHAHIFYFTTFAEVNSKSIFTEPIWYRGNFGELTSLFDVD